MNKVESNIKKLRPAITKQRSNIEGFRFKKYRSAKFLPIEKIPIASRDYGLMKSNNKSSTPYPRVDHGVDASVLRARLSMRRQLDTKRHVEKEGTPDMDQEASIEGSTSRINRGEDPHLRRTRSVIVTRPADHIQHELSLGTPHPKKGIALNAKTLTKRLEHINKVESTQSPTTKCLASPRSSNKKKGVRLVEPEHYMLEPKTPLTGSIISHKSNRSFPIEYSLSESLLLSLDSSEGISFAEKRKRFHLGEFTITKGRKISDVMMAACSGHPHVSITDKSFDYANKAKQEIENYIQKQGLIKTTNDQLTMTRTMDRTSRYSTGDSHSIKGSGASIRDHSSDESHKSIRHGRRHRSVELSH